MLSLLVSDKIGRRQGVQGPSEIVPVTCAHILGTNIFVIELGRNLRRGTDDIERALFAK
jgi:hypothetical protein